MSTEQAALIAAIRAAPDDDAPRLACAEWYAQQGGTANVARAEFIRLQLERAKLPADDVRHSALEARELRLLKRHAPEWCDSHFVFKKCRFRCGFIEYVHLHLQHFLHHRRQMLALEPVRDISLTGWWHAPTHLVQRVAACEELQWIEALRIHHQGPHKHPRSDLVLLLESPHFTRLRTLHCPMVEFDKDARHRFERLPLLRQVRELRLPLIYPNIYPNRRDGTEEWFKEGGDEFASQWQALSSLILPSYWFSADQVRRFTQLPFWDRLKSLGMGVCDYHPDQTIAVLQEKMPGSLEHFRLSATVNTREYSVPDAFFQVLSRLPLQSLHLEKVPVSPAMLGGILGPASLCQLEELSLRENPEIKEDHARVIATAPKARLLRSLDLQRCWHFDGDAGRILLSSKNLSSLVHLNLNATCIGNEGALALADAKGWDRLRSLRLAGAWVGTNGLRALVASPNLQHLVWLIISDYTVSGPGRRAGPEQRLELDGQLAATLTGLPNLAYLAFGTFELLPGANKVFLDSKSLAWISFRYNDHRAEDEGPPLDGLMEEVLFWRQG